MQPCEPEEGRWDWGQGKRFDVEEAGAFLTDLKGIIEDKLADRIHRSELIISHRYTDSTLVGSEGTNIREATPQTDIVIYLLTRDGGQGYASRILGGIGGFEKVEEKSWEETIDGLVRRSLDSARGRSLTQRGRRYKVILDEEAAGALAHEISPFLEADLHQGLLFHGLTWADEFEIKDDPGLNDAYGSFLWDDEGVIGEEKTLLGRDGLQLLHTRLTAKHGERAGNAHGVTRIPRPMISNVYIKPSDWSEEEMQQETGRGIYAEGIIGAEADTTDGRVEVNPEITYFIKKGKPQTPVKHLKIIGSIRDIQKIDAIGGGVSFRPSLEKGFTVSEGAPKIRINGITCF